MAFLFVYGTLKSGHGNNRVLTQSSATFVSKAKTANRFPMIDFGVPVVFNAEHPNAKYIKGEVWQIDMANIGWVDGLEGHPHHYRREETQVILEDGREMTVWLYFMNANRFQSYAHDSAVFIDEYVDRWLDRPILTKKQRRKNRRNNLDTNLGYTYA